MGKCKLNTDEFSLRHVIKSEGSGANILTGELGKLFTHYECLNEVKEKFEALYFGPDLIEIPEEIVEVHVDDISQSQV